MRTSRKINKHLHLFRKYSQKKDNLTLQQIKKLMKVEFKLIYNKHIMNSFIEIFGTTMHNKRVITKDTFVNKLFKKPDGFFRTIHL